MSVTAKSSMNPMSRLKIGTRVYAGFGLVLLLLGALGAVSFMGFGTIGASFDRYEVVSANTVRASVIDGSFAELRRNVLVFSTTGHEEAAKAARGSVAILSKELNELAEKLTMPARKSELQAIAKTIGEYTGRFEIVVKLRQSRDKIVHEQMNVHGSSAQRDMNAIIKSAMAEGEFEAAAVAGVAEEALMQARIAGLRYLESPEQKDIDSFKENDAAFRKGIAGLVERLKNPERKRLAVETAAIGVKYAEAFSEVTKVVSELDTLVFKTMTNEANAVTKGLAEFVKEQRETLQTIEHETDATMSSVKTTAIGLSVGAFVLGLLIAFFIARGIVRPVAGLTSGMKELAGGNFDVVLPGLDRGDEVGEMAQAVETFKVMATEKARKEAEAKIAEDARAAAQRRTDMHKMADDFQKAVGNIIDTVSSASTELEASANTLTKTAESTQALAGAVAAASEEASANVQSVASATEEMSSSVNEISRQVQESAKIAGEAVKQAHQTDARIHELSQAASRIGDVVKLISSVAEQTNLLALNATIEAARAGEAGRGFAVVASEVKQLASQTAKATEEISTQIASMQAATKDSVEAIKEISGTIGRISEISSAIAAAVEEQGAATGEISRNVGEAAKGTAMVASNITDVNRGAGETGSASSQVLSAAQSLSSESNHLKIEVDKFLLTVRAA